MSDPQLPAAIRITRAYASEEEYLEQELDTLSRTGITLIGAQQRPEGVVLRFELALSSGQVLLRGEGRVVGYKANAHHDMPGLSLRFTRLDVRSKALIDKAAAMRERRRPSFQAPPPVPVSAPAPARPPPLPARASTPPPPPFVPAPSSRDLRDPQSGARALDPPQDRDALLSRLRARSASLDPRAVAEILEQGQRR